MVLWQEAWLSQIDKNGIKFGEYIIKKNDHYATCTICKKDLKFSRKGLQSVFNHSGFERHKVQPDLRFGENVRRLQVHFVNATSSQATSFQATSSQASTRTPKLVVQPSVLNGVKSAEAKYLFKVAECDYSFRSTDDTPELFTEMFPDSKIAEKFTMSRTKASYCVSDGIGPLLLKKLIAQLHNSGAFLTMLYDETTTKQNVKQMDVLVRFWDDIQGIKTRYLVSFFFCRAKSEKLTELFIEKVLDIHELPWDKVFNTSSDGPNVNKKMHELLNNNLIARGHHGLLPFFPCSLHMVHNAFQQLITTLPNEIPQICFDLHQWFKNSPCKHEDYMAMADETGLTDESVFLRHISSRWLTLAPAIQRVLKNWPTIKKYYLDHLPNEKEYKYTLPKNKR
jgi:hypothetical protein